MGPWGGLFTRRMRGKEQESSHRKSSLGGEEKEEGQEHITLLAFLPHTCNSYQWVYHIGSVMGCSMLEVAKPISKDVERLFLWELVGSPVQMNTDISSEDDTLLQVLLCVCVLPEECGTCFLNKQLPKRVHQGLLFSRGKRLQTNCFLLLFQTNLGPIISFFSVKLNGLFCPVPG